MAGKPLSTSLALRQPTPTVMSLMGWFSESMAARYQHVTDAMRTQVASEVGDLIWADPEQARLTPMLTVRRDSFAVVVAAAQRCLALHGPDPAQAAGLAAALSDNQSCVSGEPEPPENIK